VRREVGRAEGGKAYIAMQKEETWIGQFNMRLGD